MYKPNKPSAHLVASTKLQHEWSANRCVPHISSSWLDELLTDSSFTQMNSMVKIRLLLAGLLALDKAPDLTAAGARPASQHQAASRAELQTALQRLRDVVSADADEWDKVMAAAAGPMDGRLDLDTVMQRSSAVRESMTNLMQLVASSSNQQLMTPLEDEFLRDPPSVLDPEAAHFVVRANARVQPLSAGFSYTQATPPPPSLLRAQAAHAAGAGQAAQRTAQARSQQGALSGASGLARAKSGQLDRQHSVVVLNEGEQADLYKHTQQKYGVASAVRHEQVPYEKPERSQGLQPEQQQQLRRQQQQYAQQKQQQEQRPKGTFFNIYGNKPTAPTPPPAPAVAVAQERVRQRRQQAEIDDLFDDDGFIDNREIEHFVAPTGGSRIARHLVHKHSSGNVGEEEHEKTPDDLFDEMEVDEGVVEGDESLQEGGEEQDLEGEEEFTAGGVGEGSGTAGQRAVPAGVEEQQQPSAAKRRRLHVIASDSEDDD